LNALIDRLQKLIIASGRRYYTFVMGRLNEAKLCNFPEIDLYCFISNEDESMIKPKTFHVPVLTPFELELGLGAHDWSAKYLSSSCGEYTGKSVEELVHRLELMRSSGAEDSGSENGDNREPINTTGCSEGSSSVLTKRNDQNQLTVFHSAAATRFLERGYHGLEYSVPRDQDLSVKQGQFGIAASYEQLGNGDGHK
jgi:diphthamide biosynthesis protein 2